MKIWKNRLSGLDVDGRIMVDVKWAIKEVVHAGKNPFDEITTIMQDVQKCSDQCGAVLLGVSQEQIYLADILSSTKMRKC